MEAAKTEDELEDVTYPSSRQGSRGIKHYFFPPTAPTSSSIDRLDEADARAEAALNKRVPLWVKVAIGTSLVGIMVLSFALGRYPINPVELVQTLGGLANNAFADVMRQWFGVSIATVEVDPKMATALMNIRLPRILVVVMVGAALAVAGASYQGMFKNPLVSPDLLGASAGASLGACLALLLDLSNVYVQLFAFVGAMVAVGGAVWMNKMVNKYDAILGLVLGGMLVSTLFQSGTSLIKFMADANDKLPAITFWLMGSFSRIDQSDFWMILAPMVLGFFVLMMERWKLNVLSFGEEEAKSMGINTKRVRLIVIFASTLIVACSVAVSGIVGWVGLVIPHLARAIVGPNYKVLLPASMFIGGSYLLLVDNISRLVSSTEIPIGILTAILGVPFFIFIFRHNMRGW
ncbi:MAG: iron ABC transporter permease [Gordonibacter sp.]|nr:iron ABC transporter permease [Gordonibacter sp.]